MRTSPRALQIYTYKWKHFCTTKIPLQLFPEQQDYLYALIRPKRDGINEQVCRGLNSPFEETLWALLRVSFQEYCIPVLTFVCIASERQEIVRRDICRNKELHSNHSDAPQWYSHVEAHPSQQHLKSEKAAGSNYISNLILGNSDFIPMLRIGQHFTGKLTMLLRTMNIS